MKVNKMMVVRFALCSALAVGFASCSKKSSSTNKSAATGSSLDGKNGGFKLNANFKSPPPAPGLVLIEGGTFTMGKVQDDVMHDWNNSPNQQHVQSFYMDETEVTNGMYAEYLFWIKKVYPPTDDKYKNIYEGVIPDTLVWRNRLGYNESMTNNYLRHPSYANYPVVGVNWIQATEFAKWRTDRVAENSLEQAGFLKKNAKNRDVSAEKNFSVETYLAAPNQTFAGDSTIVFRGRGGRAKTLKARGSKGQPATTVKPTNVYIQTSSGILPQEYRLPTEAEWEYAAAADVGFREFNMYKGQKKYPWKGSYTRSNKRSSQGDQLANFKQGKGDYGGIAGWSDDAADITNKVKYYPPNDFGLYDMAGNVAEWVADVYRPMVDDEANDFNYYRGNVFNKNKIGQDGRLELVTSENMVYDTVSNGKIMARSFPGQLNKIPVDEKETYLRQNFSQSDNRNYKDGDKMSSRYFKGGSDEDGKKNEKRMYDSPVHNISKDSLDNIVRAYDKSNKRTTLINDESRVYKGGSWRDRAYWLDPAQRRYFPQDMATDYIGFRCAMSKVGAKSTKRRTIRP